MNPPRRGLSFRVGAPVPQAPPPSTDITLIDEVSKALRPTVILVAILTGAAFAVGSGLVSRYLFRDHRRR